MPLDVGSGAYVHLTKTASEPKGAERRADPLVIHTDRIGIAAYAALIRWITRVDSGHDRDGFRVRTGPPLR